jgi:class 3 adenylate cyclase
MLPGVKAMFIFGFCDIRNFTDATEVLEEGVMLFVNEIGEIIHGIANQFQGFANKNVGDAFLLVWKFEEEDQYYDEETEALEVQTCTRVQQLADMSVISFLLLISGLKKSKKMVKYNTHKGLNERMPNYEVKLGLGLHLGYAIEGAIGSYYKIDASYLSPNVRMSETLESLTKYYRVPLLISGPLHKHLTVETQDHCR